MKKMILVFLMLISTSVIAQQNNTWTPEQQEQFRQQMEAFREQMQQQMQSLKDSLNRMQQKLNNNGFIQSDELHIEFPEMPEMPQMPPMPSDEEFFLKDGQDSTEVRLGRWNVVVNEHHDGEDRVHVYKSESDDECSNENELKNVETRFFQLDVGVNNYFAKGFSSSFPQGFEKFDPNPGKSWVVNIHAIDQRLNLIRYHLWFGYGVYFELNSYKYNTKSVIIPGIDSLAFSSGDESLSKNKLSCEYAGIPLTLRYESNPSHMSSSFHISGGVFGEYLLGAHTKTKSSTGKNKVHDDFNLNRVRYGITARAGYGWLNVYTNISISELLVEGSGPVLYPFSAGLAFEF